jgi:hypothetical protein
MKVIAVMAQPSGSGQTTVLVNLATGLARRGYRVLVGELGSNQKLRSWLGFDLKSMQAIDTYPSCSDPVTDIFSSRLGIDLLDLTPVPANCIVDGSYFGALEQMGYDYILLHPFNNMACQDMLPLVDIFLVVTDLDDPEETQNMIALHNSLSGLGAKVSGISMIIPNRINTKEWEHSSHQLMALADYFGLDKLSDPLPT